MKSGLRVTSRSEGMFLFQNGNPLLLTQVFQCRLHRAELQFCCSKGRTLHMPKKLFLVFVLLLAATAAVAATSDSSSANATVTPAIRTYLTPNLSLRSVFSPDFLPQTADPALQSDGLAAAPAKLGFCQCGCGIRCSTSADCGGAACRPFITCCDRKAQSSNAEWFRTMASHKTAVSEAILNGDCK